MESPRALSTETTSSKPGHIWTDEISTQKSDPNSHQSTLGGQPSERLIISANSSEARIKDEPVRDNNFAELKEYNILIKSMLHEIDSRKARLEENRHIRIKNGVLNIHSGEITRFQLEHGPSIHIDHLLFAYVCLVSWSCFEFDWF